MTLGTAESAAIGAAVTGAVQLLKKAGVPDRMAWPAVFVVSAVFLALWVISQGAAPTRTDAWPIAIAYIAICTIASGVYELASTTFDSSKKAGP